MAKKEGQPEQNQYRFAFAIPTDLEIKPGGGARVYGEIVASDEEVAKILRDEMQKEVGADVTLETEERERSSSFAFGSWDMCRWNPLGPRKNWGPPPDPSRN
ncbi:hypothetical protein A3B51_00720 [Candidatus Curtissbacteria bacterium RIFCSPLOWO2_01_FULL_41_18]|uniref:Uncharacterized protein n=2 Tax=Candidatus Curtissiibacteriota TaxID=1752717 RepID=A0A1F5G0H0_9BACT|nr:MAG: hypothetical protein A2696_03000 [Candidatus Curtissbacteria bacterium RIFCSPHIGHO2_01_FULL_41_13]OGE03745.1 MAG: hypothetical protein A3B51_00720 [Candidatus Curtissbacteria bacterium RIFCSPLOWO2_01_FULL_41_18]